VEPSSERAGWLALVIIANGVEGLDVRYTAAIMEDGAVQMTANMLPLDDTDPPLPPHEVHGEGNESEGFVVIVPGDDATARTGAADGELDVDNETKPLPDIAT